MRVNHEWKCRGALAVAPGRGYHPGMLSTDNQSTRERSLRAAVDVVRADGIHELTTRAIARRSGLTQPAIYRHFASKQELVGEALGAIRSLFLDRLSAVDEDGDAMHRLIATLECFRDFAVEEARLYDALFLQQAVGAATAPAPAGQGGNIFGTLVDRVRACGREGSLPADGPVSITLSLVAQVQGLVLLYRQGRFPNQERFASFFRRSIEDLLRGVGG